MANTSKRKYKRNFCIGIRIEIPNKFLNGKDLFSIYKKNNKILLVDLCKGGKVIPKYFNGLVLAKNEGSGGNVSNFSILVNFGEDLEKVKRITKIINILGDDKLFKEKLKMFISGKSVLNAIPELIILKQSLIILDQIIPRFSEVAWYSAPDAKLR